LVVSEGDTQWRKAINDPVLSDCFERRAAAVSNHNDVSATGRGTVVQVTNNIVQPTHSRRTHEEKSPGVALLLSFLILGLGQCYNGQYGKGALMFFLGIFLWIFLLGWIVWIWSMIDAYHSAVRLNDE
jgi:TM2 domain-containing membrane protein YozV